MKSTLKLDTKSKKNSKKWSFAYIALPLLCFFTVSAFGIEGAKDLVIAKQMTLSIVKPDAVEKNQIGNILSRFEKKGLKIVAAKMVKLSKKDAETFYEVHKGKPFYEELVNFMISGPIMVSVLEGEDAIAKNREIMGTTDPKKAEIGTIRKDFGQSVGKNAIHGSDAIDTAKKEIAFFFKENEIFSR